MTQRSELLERSAAFPGRVALAARAAATRPTPVGEWTPVQVARHLIAVDLEVHQGRLGDLAQRDEPTWSWQEPGLWAGEPGLTLDGVLDRIADVRRETLAAFERLDEAGWRRAGRHATFGTLDAEGLLRLAVDHDEEHLAALVTG